MPKQFLSSINLQATDNHRPQLENKGPQTLQVYQLFLQKRKTTKMHFQATTTMAIFAGLFASTNARILLGHTLSHNGKLAIMKTLQL